MNWEEKEKEAIQNRLERADKTATEIIEKELDCDFFNFNGSDSLDHKIGKERIVINSNPNFNQTNSSDASPTLALHSFDEAFHDLMIDTY